MTDETPVLLTFAPMIDSEFARLVLAHHGVRYREDDHLFGWVSLLTLAHGGYGRIPLLHGGGFRTTGPLPLAARLDALAPESRRLVPSDEQKAAEVRQDVGRFNGQLALSVARFAYFHLLSQRELMTGIFARPVPASEGRMMPRLYPATRLLFRLLLQLGPQPADAAQRLILRECIGIENRLSCNPEFLVGDRLSLADLALMASLAPVLLPEGYGAIMPAPDQLHAALRDLRDHLLPTATAAYVQRQYRRLIKTDQLASNASIA